MREGTPIFGPHVCNIKIIYLLGSKLIFQEPLHSQISPENIFEMVDKVSDKHRGPYSPTILKNILAFSQQNFLYLEALERSTASGWQNHMIYSIKCVTFKCTKYWRRQQNKPNI